MKRSKSINLSRMRKVAIAATAVALVACEEEEDVLVVSTVEECVAKSSLSEQECQAAYQQAINESEKTAPQYDSAADCEAEFGMGECQSGVAGNNYYPMMDGFMLMSDMTHAMAGYHYNPIFVYRGSDMGMRGHYMTASGSTLGRPGQSSYRVSSSTVKAQPRATTTTSRGGFGRVAASRASYSGGSRTSFGG